MVKLNGVTDRKRLNAFHSFVEVADCQVKVRLHRTADDSAVAYIGKVKKMKNELEKYIEHLEDNL